MAVRKLVGLIPSADGPDTSGSSLVPLQILKKPEVAKISGFFWFDAIAFTWQSSFRHSGCTRHGFTNTYLKKVNFKGGTISFLPYRLAM
jgi:hypothetical protein